MEVPDPTWVDKVNALFIQVVTSPALPAVLAAAGGHFVIDWLKGWRDAKDKPMRPATVRLLSVLVTQVAFVVFWSSALWFRTPRGKWGDLDFLYGLVGSLFSILWHHYSPWKPKPDTTEPPEGGAPVA